MSNYGDLIPVCVSHTDMQKVACFSLLFKLRYIVHRQGRSRDFILSGTTVLISNGVYLKPSDSISLPNIVMKDFPLLP